MCGNHKFSEEVQVLRNVYRSWASGSVSQCLSHLSRCHALFIDPSAGLRSHTSPPHCSWWRSDCTAAAGTDLATPCWLPPHLLCICKKNRHRHRQTLTFKVLTLIRQRKQPQALLMPMTNLMILCFGSLSPPWNRNTCFPLPVSIPDCFSVSCLLMVAMLAVETSALTQM